MEFAAQAMPTLGAVAQAWASTAGGVAKGRGRSAPGERYANITCTATLTSSSDPAQPPLGSLPCAALTVDCVALWSLANEAALAPTTARIALITLNQICRFAVLGRGWLSENPVMRLEPGEKPRWKPGNVAILEGADLARVLEYCCGSYRLMFEVLAYSGLRIGELLGLTWADVDLHNGTLHVHRQLSRQRLHRPLKTERGVREVLLAPAMILRLRERWLASAFKTPDDLVFCTQTGRGVNYRRVGEVFRNAVRRSGVRRAGRLSLHSLRHGYASLLIGNNVNPQFVSRQLGHANPSVTLGVYSHLFARREHGELARQALDASYGAMMSTIPRETEGAVVTAMVTKDGRAIPRR